MLTAITGINWGDEGKGRMVDLLCRDYDIVARYQGGDNAGHTVKNECGKFVLNLVPSGILHPSIVCVMGGGMVIDPEHLEKEIADLREQGVKITPDNLKISDRATITMPFHVEQDGLEEARLAKTGAQFGSTKRGIAYTYGDKYMKKTLRMGDLVSAAPNKCPLCTASARARQSTVEPRPTFSRIAPCLQRARRAASNMCSVSGVPGRLRATRSACGSSASSSLWGTTRRQ